MKDYADQLIAESRNNVYHSAHYTLELRCPNRFPLREKHDWADPERYERKKARAVSECPSGMDGKVPAGVKEDGIWTTLKCPVCGYVGDDDDWCI